MRGDEGEGVGRIGGTKWDWMENIASLEMLSHVTNAGSQDNYLRINL